MSAWTDFATKFYNDKKKKIASGSIRGGSKNPYTFKEALKEAAVLYKAAKNKSAKNNK